MTRVARKIARRLSKDVRPWLRACCLLMFCISVIAIPQTRVRLVESSTAELLPEDTGSSQKEETESQIVADRTIQSRGRLIVINPSAGSTSSHACQASYAEHQEQAGWQSFAEKVRPMRC